MSQLTTARQHVATTSFGPVRLWESGPAGAQVPLVFLQGLLAPPRVWDEVVGSLTEHQRCITVDWPFGAHEQPMRADADLSPPGIARLAVEILDGLGIERAVLVGNDSGGVIAQLVVAAHPDRIASLALVACDAFEVFPPRQYRPLFRLARIPGTVELLALALRRPFVARSGIGLGAVVSDTSRLGDLGALLADPLIRRDLRKLLVGSSNAQTLAAAQSFHRFGKPVLVVWAGDDRLFTPSLGRRLASAFPRGRLEVIAGSRTFVPVDQPARLAGLIAGFLDEAAAA
jgi:pimeloyl-ACP methyl ester carboxylesterase